MTPQYQARDKIVANGIPATVLSWPVTNEGPASIEFYDTAQRSYTRAMIHVGFDTVSAYTGDHFPTSLDEDNLSAQAPADTIEEAPVEQAVNVGEFTPATNTEETLSDPVAGEEPLPIEEPVVEPVHATVNATTVTAESDAQ